MNKYFRLALIVGLLMLLYACGQSPDSTFTIIGTLKTVDAPNTDSDDEEAENDEDRLNWTTANVVVSHAITDSGGQIEVVELASGTFDEGSITLNGNIDQPTKVKISVETEGADPLTLNAVIAPEVNISFVLVEYPAFDVAQLEFFGASRMVMDLNNKFSISGDLSEVDADFERATIEVRASEYDALGERVPLNYGTVMLDDEAKFIVEADVDEPRIVNILVLLPVIQKYTQFHAIVEPGSEIEVKSFSSWFGDLYPISGTGKHAELVESWQQSDEYISTKEEYRTAVNEYGERERADDESVRTGEGVTPRYRELGRKLNRMRYDFLEDVATNAEDPMNVLLALDLGAFWGQEDALPIYDRLAEAFDEDFVVRRVIHDRNYHAAHLESVGINRSLVVGKQAPDFTLPNLEGELFSLTEIQQKNEYVLVDFWAAWCGPCIESLPALKDLYTSYRDSGFEIVSISIDDHHDAWVEGSTEHELPWVNLGELKGFRGEIATAYGVTFIPKSYLLDQEGLIVQKDLEPKQLQEWLAETYGDFKE